MFSVIKERYSACLKVLQFVMSLNSHCFIFSLSLTDSVGFFSSLVKDKGPTGALNS